MRNALLRPIASVSRRLDRPELVAVFDEDTRRIIRDETARRTLVAALLGPADVYVDVGTNRGQWIGDVVSCSPQGQHIAFEPIPELADVVRRRFTTVDVRACALSDSSGAMSFTRFAALDGFSGLVRRPDVTDTATEIPVRVATLDDELGSAVPRLVKIDVEGAEVRVLRGAQRTLAEHRPHVVFEHQPEASALYDDSSVDLWELLYQQDYRVFSLDGDGPWSSATFARRAESGAVLDWLATPN